MLQDVHFVTLCFVLHNQGLTQLFKLLVEGWQRGKTLPSEFVVHGQILQKKRWIYIYNNNN